MTIFIDAHNTISAGATSVTTAFLDGLLTSAVEDRCVVFVPDIPVFAKFREVSTPTRKVIFAPQFAGTFQVLMRLVFQVLVIPALLLRFMPDRVFVFGNYLLMPWRKKTIFMQTAYIVDDRLLEQTPWSSRIEEHIVRFLFRLTLFSSSSFVVQNTRMRDLLARKYGLPSAQISILPTPISSALAEKAHTARSVPPCQGNRRVLYVSRFYAHKNHAFLVRLAERYRNDLQLRRIEFAVTIDPVLSSQAAALLEEIQRKDLGSIIINIGELPQQELAAHYESACMLLFPSQAESFGLPLVEAMAFGLPVVVPDLEYAHDICGDAGIYFSIDDREDAMLRILRLCDDASFWQHHSTLSLQRFASFPSVDAWTAELFRVIKGS